MTDIDISIHFFDPLPREKVCAFFSSTAGDRESFSAFLLTSAATSLHKILDDFGLCKAAAAVADLEVPLVWVVEIGTDWTDTFLINFLRQKCGASSTFRFC